MSAGDTPEEKDPGTFRYDVAIAGAGVVGLSCALHAAMRGLKVIVVDPNPVLLKVQATATHAPLPKN